MMVQMCWPLKLRASENMQVQWCCKGVRQPHHFDWEASLVLPIASWCRIVSFSVSKCDDFLMSGLWGTLCC